MEGVNIGAHEEHLDPSMHLQVLHLITEGHSLQCPGYTETPVLLPHFLVLPVDAMHELYQILVVRQSACVQEFVQAISVEDRGLTVGHFVDQGEQAD